MMAVLHDDWIFVHVPKCAGTSIVLGLGVDSETSVAEHLPLAALPGRTGKFAWGFVRNPWERQLSYYSFLLAAASKAIAWQMRERWDFRHWLLETETWLNDGGGPVDPPIQRRPMSWWLEGCDFVGRVETIGEDFAEVCARIGVQPNLPLLRANASHHRPYREMYDTEMRDAVAGWFAPDIARFGYEF